MNKTLVCRVYQQPSEKTGMVGNKNCHKEFPQRITNTVTGGYDGRLAKDKGSDDLYYSHI